MRYFLYLFNTKHWGFIVCFVGQWHQKSGNRNNRYGFIDFVILSKLRQCSRICTSDVMSSFTNCT